MTESEYEQIRQENPWFQFPSFKFLPEEMRINIDNFSKDDVVCRMTAAILRQEYPGQTFSFDPMLVDYDRDTE